MTPEDDDIRKQLEKTFRELREGLAKAEPQVIPPEPVLEFSDGKADQEALAFAEKRYDVEEARRRAETQSVIESNRDKKINRHLRWKYAKWVFCYLVSYSIFVGLVVLLAAADIFHLPETVLGYLVGSTAVAAIGLVFAVTNGLFGGGESGS